MKGLFRMLDERGMLRVILGVMIGLQLSGLLTTLWAGLWSVGFSYYSTGTYEFSNLSLTLIIDGSFQLLLIIVLLLLARKLLRPGAATGGPSIPVSEAQPPVENPT